MVETRINGQPWVQKTFPYQVKCPRWLQEAYATLGPDDRRAVDSTLDATGCEGLVAMGA